ncbi:arylsulfatase [Verrucomicrobiaceae bacterium N1E253]|uniref:Arylsulfatase n=1 Tax=Oceaniferula marina TaxID=2748318 RepID=A0A851GJG7_9BACT|nr:arylsulfatase [Oceaniferula marina]NWK57476.1 arylsulfatase [Oceaniferula marina]
MKHFLLSLSAATALFAPLSAADKPNIVFILADDLGYSELGCYGQKKIKTPHVDKLAKEGMRFTQHYTGAPVCAPARCVLLTGKHLAHAEIRGNRDSGNGQRFPGQWPLSDQALTIAEVLKEQGYATGAFGKWGLGPTQSSGAPNKQGFNRFYGFICQRNAHSYYPPYLDSDDKEITINEHPIPGHKRQKEGTVKAEDYRAEHYAPDLVLKEALDFIDTHKDQPFFLYLPFIEPHVAIQPPQEWIDKYPKGWDNKPYRGERGYLPHPRPNAGYAAMISDLDEHVGAIIQRLDQHGLSNNTLVIFTSDNGPTHNVGGVTTEFFNSTLNLRGKKGSCYEGGLRIPCIVRWPGKVKAGSQTDAASYFPDWFPTLCDISGSKRPDTNLDGVTLAPVLEGGELPERHEPMIWEFSGYGGIIAIRHGKWKAIKRGLKRKGKPGKWELYDIEKDRAESKDLADKYPETIKQIEQRWLRTRTVEPDFPLPDIDRK